MIALLILKLFIWSKLKDYNILFKTENRLDSDNSKHYA